MNRVLARIGQAETMVAEKLASGAVTQDKVDAMHKQLDMEVGECCQFQTLKSLAVGLNKLTLEEGQTVYCLLGNTPEHFNGQSCAVKVVLTKLFAELLDWSIKSRKAA